MSKKVAYGITLAGLLLPFVFITDFYPFFRLGMFAEPVKRETQKEYFLLYECNETSCTPTNPDSLKFNPANFHTLIRNYYYRNEGEIFLSKIASLKPSVKEWKLYRKTAINGDSTLLSVWKK